MFRLLNSTLTLYRGNSWIVLFHEFQFSIKSTGRFVHINYYTLTWPFSVKCFNKYKNKINNDFSQLILYKLLLKIAITLGILNLNHNKYRIYKLLKENITKIYTNTKKMMTTEINILYHKYSFLFLRLQA